MRSFYGFKFESHIRFAPKQELCLISILLNTLNFLIHNNDKTAVIGLQGTKVMKSLSVEACKDAITNIKPPMLTIL
jgi:hypothetical protein